ncbi:UNVERIFIED_CONTAM: hypothetical protein Slati_3693300 [Sesamum latifolium]|uniref:Endonuclease/exonuclease/phosphatase n=1 Tax=Sesamum latifolium TaxID=2727402 RepID=A0AAW2U195_9LAMI
MLRELVKRYNPGLVFLSETKSKARRVESLKQQLNYLVWGLRYVARVGIYVCDGERMLRSGSSPFRLTTLSLRLRDLWTLLKRLHSGLVRLWLCMGDFNDILYQYEKQGGRERALWQIEVFRQCLMDCDLQDLVCEGDPFMWCNHLEAPGTIKERLDRARGNRRWLDCFPKASVLHLSMTFSIMRRSFFAVR